MAEDEDKESKTEEPSERKLQRARQEGQVAISQEIKSLLMLVTALALVAMLAPWLSGQLKKHLGSLLASVHAVPLDPEGFRMWFLHAILKGIIFLSPVFAITFLAAILSGTLQYGLVFTPKKIAPKLSNISMISGFRRIFSRNQLFELAKGVLKIILVTAVFLALVVPHLATPEVYMALDPTVVLENLHTLLVLVLAGVVVTFSLVAAADWWWQRYRHREQLKMTKQEVKDEHKDTEGDPQIKGKIRQMRLQRSRQRMMAAVPQASVVITNPTHYAVALRYEMDEMSAPKLVAKGVDSLALRIRAIAEEHDIPIMENPPLARVLYSAVELDQEIPPEHYKAVAEVIGYVMKLKRAGLTGRSRRSGQGADRVTADERGQTL
ncbi:flagellar biosynthesis protein FlhB [Haematospirillum sp. H1815]|uniref:flagellar biosynthesis protein FlhB n=1 Tax=Haematospirillum sp. H1815 TaxID=2723108 RepID=UPI001438FD23|nr:flagellar biosynthesis protein FlhB [Haematospirillum sp. H1815]NKD77603.1 flagellar biosynthesis protein FlhB [Haematospirillum sp. H1815]